MQRRKKKLKNETRQRMPEKQEKRSTHSRRRRRIRIQYNFGGRDVSDETTTLHPHYPLSSVKSFFLFLSSVILRSRHRSRVSGRFPRKEKERQLDSPKVVPATVPLAEIRPFAPLFPAPSATARILASRNDR